MIRVYVYSGLETPLVTPMAAPTTTRKRSTRTATKAQQEPSEEMFDITVPMAGAPMVEPMAKEAVLQAATSESSFASPRKALGDVTNSSVEVRPVCVVDRTLSL